MVSLNSLERTHDLRLPDWGPYTKKYSGISHLPDGKSGLRFDLSVFPGYYRRQVLVPNAKWESGFHPWEAAPDLSYYAYRYELEWKDQVYCDISYSALGPNSRLIRSEFVNQTAQSQNLVLHYMASLNFPPLHTYSDEPIQPSRVHLPDGALWLDALDYTDLGFAYPRPQDTLGQDGKLRGEIRANDFVNGSGIGEGFGRDQNDWVRYRFRLETPMLNAVLLLRYRAPEGNTGFNLTGILEKSITLPLKERLSLLPIPLQDLPAGEHAFELTAHGGAEIELDGWVLVPENLIDQVRFEAVNWQPVPEILPGPLPNSLLLKYADVNLFYGLTWLDNPWEIRELYTAELDRFLRYYVQEHVRKALFGDGEGHFTNVFLRPIEVLPGQSKVLYGMVCSGSQEEVEKAISSPAKPTELPEIHYQKARAKMTRLEGTPAGERYRFSQEKMAATVLTNVVYPVYTRRSYIRHYTPGKWWDCLYTWDSGFIGLGLLELDINRAVDCLNAYTTFPGDPQAAFLHHGSLVPVQHYLFHELWNRTQDTDLLEYFYPRLKQYYRFFAGRSGSSTTRQMKSGLLKTWDYFYNSGGWDDYPPQVYVHENGLEATTTPVISTAHGIRTAKIMQAAAHALRAAQDAAEYQADIDQWVTALNQYAWDGEAGYFSYVCHTADGEPESILRHASGQNYDMGLDGAAPLFAGVCSPTQEQILLEHLTSPKRLWTPLGISTVDQQAAYYKVDGYWNGAVWFPQQWFYWKALLDLDQGDFAAQVAQTALETWKAEVDTSYNCFEHFIIQSGRGAGWHQFGGLSTPVLLWYSAYHRPGRLTTGFDTWIEQQQFSQGDRRLESRLITQQTGQHTPRVIAAMHPAETYSVTWKGHTAEFQERYPGVLEIALNGEGGQGQLIVQPAGS